MEILQTIEKVGQRQILKHISDQEIKESILENNRVPSNFLFWQKLDDYLLEEARKKDEKSSQIGHW